jgi:Holliday junction resolvase
MNSSREAGNRFEREIVNEAKGEGLEARRQPLSGSTPSHPNDVVLEDILIEAKIRGVVADASSNKSIRFQMSWLRGVVSSAKAHGYRMGVVVFRMKGDKQRYVTLSWDDFIGLIKSSKT